ncbi:hypothetical protein ABZ883_41770 [Streptomyces sp. NPDC046977]|uniref:hypothetical protein n=1 Tax=Streptomyces sp. NPDC046977 TaxID=3154703 RepID=UPI0033FD0F68
MAVDLGEVRGTLAGDPGQGPERRQPGAVHPAPDDLGRPLTHGKVAAECAVGNEDGAYKVSVDAVQVLKDVGFPLGRR